MTIRWQRRPDGIQRHLSIFIIFYFCVIGSLAGDEFGPSKNESPVNGSTGKPEKQPVKLISLAESINRSQTSLGDPERAKASREQWQRALQEIKEITNPKEYRTSQTTKGPGLFSQWKLLLDEPSKLEIDSETTATTTPEDIQVPSPVTEKSRKLPRFEGFASWERTLQDWADDVQEYLDKVEAETTEYPMSTFGTPRGDDVKRKKLKSEPAEQQEQEEESDDDVEVTESLQVPDDEDMTTKKKRISLPVPAAVKPGEDVVPYTDLSDKSKRIWIVTTASLPWMTGTAVNPLLRAAYLAEGRTEEGSVTLMLPWLERRSDQEQVYGSHRVFESQKEQEDYVRTWLRETAKMPDASEKLKIEWYTSWQNKAENSLYSMGDITALIPAEDVDICILEEPEHLNWYRAPGESWTDKFKHVVGIIHTNYFVYAQEQPAAFIRAPGMRLLCSWMCRAHCHRVIKLSGTLGQFAPEKELVENVHGVRGRFLEIGSEVKTRLTSSAAAAADDPIFSADAEPSVYFIGKMLWSKGLGSLMELLKYAEESAGIRIHVDMYGGGPDKDAAAARAKGLDVDLKFHGPIDHAELAFTHKIFVNPSTSEVLCTTVAEALAMGKFVVVPSHPSNDFFAQFSNCLTYTNKEEFVGNLYYALTHSPEPMTTESSYALSWKAATERLEAAGSIPVAEAEAMAKALSSNDAGIEISLPPFIESDKDRKLLASTIRQTRKRYRSFRSRLSQELRQSNVLPKGVKQRLVTELDKRLDLNIDTMIDSPKLRLQLSPAELDKQLLDLYKIIAEGPRGDVLRVIGGGQEVAFQTLYIKRQAARDRVKNRGKARMTPSFGPFENFDDLSSSSDLTVSRWVQQALRRNLPRNDTSTSSKTTMTATATMDAAAAPGTSTAPLPSQEQNQRGKAPVVDDDDESKLKMVCSSNRPLSRSYTTIPKIPYPTVTMRGNFVPFRSCCSKFNTLLI